MEYAQLLIVEMTQLEVPCAMTLLLSFVCVCNLLTACMLHCTRPLATHFHNECLVPCCLCVCKFVGKSVNMQVSQLFHLLA